MTIRLKRGSLSKDDKLFVEKFLGQLTPEQIAGRLRRPLSTIDKYITENPKKYPTNQEKDIKLGDALRLRPEWKQFEQQFTEEELEHFEYKYVQLMTEQFKDNILPTEEMQLFQVITIDIMIMRCMREQKFVVEEMKRVEGHISEVEQALDEGQEDETVLGVQLEALMAAYNKQRSTLRSFTQRYESYLMRQGAMLKDLKSTRDQRIKVSDDGRMSFSGYLRHLQEEEFREQTGRDMELMRKATEKEMKRLTKPHKYVDGVVDQPLLIPEAVDD